jgi:hypothetical protein
MARYTGPKTRIARKFGEGFSEMIKLSKKKFLCNTGWLKKEEKI